MSRVLISPQYIAGFLDADGCISISGPGLKRPKYRCMVILTNNDLEVLQEIQKAWGGRISCFQGRCYHLNFRSKEQLPFLKAIHPYLRIKKNQAELAILYRLSYEPEKGTRPVPDMVIQLRDRFCQEMRKLNKYKDTQRGMVIPKK